MTNLSFSPVSAARWVDIKTMFAQQANIQITTDTGSGSSHGIQFTWAFDSSALAVVIVSVPWALRLTGLNEQKVADEFSAWINGVK